MQDFLQEANAPFFRFFKKNTGFFARRHIFLYNIPQKIYTVRILTRGGGPVVTNDMTFAQRLALLRRERGFSQKSVAEKMNVSQALLSHYEKGIREPGLDFVVRIARLYGVTADFLLGLDDMENESVESQVMKSICSMMDVEELRPALEGQLYSLLRLTVENDGELFRMDEHLFATGAVLACSNRAVARATAEKTDIPERIRTLKKMFPEKYEGLIEMLRRVEQRTMDFLG